MAKAKRSKTRAKKRTEKITLNFTAEDLELIAKAADHALETRGRWAYRRLVFAARSELGLEPEKKQP